MGFKDNVKNKIKSTFETFENRAITPVENKICKTAIDIENKLIDVGHNIEDKAENYSQKIDAKNMFILLKKKKDNLLS